MRQAVMILAALGAALLVAGVITRRRTRHRVGPRRVRVVERLQTAEAG